MTSTKLYEEADWFIVQEAIAAYTRTWLTHKCYLEPHNYEMIFRKVKDRCNNCHTKIPNNVLAILHLVTL
jgi:hypothetical protein